MVTEINLSTFKSSTQALNFPVVEILDTPKFLGVVLSLLQEGDCPIIYNQNGAIKKLCEFQLTMQAISMLLQTGTRLRVYKDSGDSFVVTCIEDFVEGF